MTGRRLPPQLKVVLVLAGVIGVLLGLAGGGARASAAATSGGGRAVAAGRAGSAGRVVSTREGLGLSLLGQSSWVLPGQTFQLDLALSGRAEGSVSPADLEVETIVYQSLFTRTAFALSQQGHDLGRLLWSQEFPITKLPGAAAGGGYSICIPLDVHPSGSCPAADDLRTGGRPGVYPVEVELRDPASDQVLSRLYTHLIEVPDKPATNPLQVAVVVPFGAPEPLSPTGTRRLDNRQVARLDQLQDGLAGHGPVALTLAPDPSTLSALADTPGGAARDTLAGLRRTAAGVQVLARPFAPVAPAELVANGLEGELAAQVQRGGDVVGNELGRRPSPATWLLQGSIDRSSALELAGLGARALVVPSSDLESSNASLTPAQPFPLQVGTTSVPALVEDPGLSTDLGLSDPVLAVHELLADLAQIYYESPNLLQYVGGHTVPESRGVVALAPPQTALPAAAGAALVEGLAHSPLLSATTLDQLIADLPMAHRARLAASPGRRANLDAGQVRSLRADLASLAASVQGPVPSAVLIGDLLLSSEASGSSPARRAAYLSGARRVLGTQLHQVAVAASGITLTSRQGKVPISIVSNLGAPIRVRVSLSSNRLAFAGAGGKDRIARDLTLRLRNTTWLVPVTARTTGSFAVLARVQTGDGRVMLDTARVAITSRAFSGVGVAMSIAALAVLAFWWGRALQKGRRNRHLVERGHPEHPEYTGP